MQIVFDCPRCLQRDVAKVEDATASIHCTHCDWSRPVPAGTITANVPATCLVCGCQDLWRQKDFPPLIGLLLVGAGILLSTVAIAYMRPLLGMGILMAFALADMVLFTVMKDCLVCYRCHARIRGTGPLDQHPKFNLELNERYRQELARTQSVANNPGTPVGKS